MPETKPYTVDWEKTVPITLRNHKGREIATVEGHPVTFHGIMDGVVHQITVAIHDEREDMFLDESPPDVMKTVWRVSDPMTGFKITCLEGSPPEVIVGKVAAQLIKGGRTKEEVEERQLAWIERFTTL